MGLPLSLLLTSRVWPLTQSASSIFGTVWLRQMSKTGGPNNVVEHNITCFARNQTQYLAIISYCPWDRHRRGSSHYDGDYRRRSYRPGPATDRKHGQQHADDESWKEIGSRSGYRERAFQGERKS